MTQTPHSLSFTKPPRLVIVSNRVPARSSTPGGLAVAMSDALRDRESLWFGWSGDPESSRPGNVTEIVEPPLTYLLLDLSKEDFAGYYEGYSNGTLWPAFHYRLDLSGFDQGELDAYLRVNRQIADHLVGYLRPDDLIWIHDYHLLCLPGALRRHGVNNRIGFFSHIPFPSPEIFKAIPGRAQIVRGLLGADLIGFQSNRDRSNFERYVCEHEGGYWLPDGRVAAHERTVHCQAFPIGIDAVALEDLAKSSIQTDALKRVARQSADHDLVIGVDRMDYSKGLPERLDALDELFTRQPSRRGRTTLVQIAPVSRGNVEAYARLRERLESQVGHLNGKYSTLDWAPVQFIAQAVERDQIAGLLRLARVGLVTPLRDGMNLVAKEYVAAQDPHDPGVLILSEFAGAAEQLSEALIINPHNVGEQADAIETALSMPLAERKRRHAALKAVIDRQNARWWSNAFTEELSLGSDQTVQVLGQAIGNLLWPTDARKPADAIK